MLLLGFQISIFVEHDISYTPSKFQSSRISGSNFTEEGRKHQCFIGTKNSSAFRVNVSKKIALPFTQTESLSGWNGSK